MENRKNSLYAETINEVFRRCLDRANINTNKGQMPMLSLALEEEFDLETRYYNYMRNVHDKMVKALKQTSQVEIRVDVECFRPLCLYAGIDNIIAFNKQFKRWAIRVAFSNKVFNLFDFLRITDTGYLKLNNETWFFVSTDGSRVEGSVKQFEPFIMPGDKSAYWVKVEYVMDGTEGCAYFAEYGGSPLKVQDDESKLYSFFSKLKY